MSISNSTFDPHDTTHHSVLTHHHSAAVRAAGAGSGIEALAGIGAIALAILGLAGVLPFVFAGIAALAVGSALLFEGLAMAGSFAEEVRRRMIPADRKAEMTLGSGLSAQVLGGAAGVTLAILALAGVTPWTLLGVAAIVFGATMLVGGAVQPELLDEEVLTGGAPETASRLSAQAVRTSGGASALAGLATLALGIIAMVNPGTPLMHTLVLVAFLVAGSANLLGGTAVLGRVAEVLR